jgi:hypothetical protein
MKKKSIQCSVTTQLDRTPAGKPAKHNPNHKLEPELLISHTTQTTGTTTNKNKEQIDASTTDRTNLFAGLSAEAQKVIDNMLVEELANVISFYEQTKMPLGGILGLEDLPADKNFVPRWRFQLRQPLVKPELVNKLPTKMRRFHDWYLQKSAAGLEMFGMLVRPGDFDLQNEKVVWLQFIDIYEICYLNTVNTDLMMV